VPVAALKFSASSTRQTLKLSDIAERMFCSGCGSPITMAYAFKPNRISVVVSSIDQGSLKGEPLKVSKHIYLSEKAPWFAVPDDVAERSETSTMEHLIRPKAEQ
jgi:hypothetical protein